jgi:hypothetical protein
VIVIELEIDGDEQDAADVVDRVLDTGILQDAINDHEFDAGPVRVTSAVVVVRPSKIPPCAAAMGCLCAGHARGNDADAACDTSEANGMCRHGELEPARCAICSVD